MKPELAIISERAMKDMTVVDIDTSKAKYQGRAWRDLGDWGKRKFENFLFLQRMETDRTYLKIRYV